MIRNDMCMLSVRALEFREQDIELTGKQVLFCSWQGALLSVVCELLDLFYQIFPIIIISM